MKDYSILGPMHEILEIINVFISEGPLCSVTAMRRKLQAQLFHLHVKGNTNKEVRAV